MSQGKSTQQFWELYELFNIEDWHLDGVYLPALARQIPKMLGLFFVVTFGSCLDVAAIQADMPFPIDFNSELGTVGLSNMIVGLSGRLTCATRASDGAAPALASFPCRRLKVPDEVLPSYIRLGWGCPFDRAQHVACWTVVVPFGRNGPWY